MSLDPALRRGAARRTPLLRRRLGRHGSWSPAPVAPTRWRCSPPASSRLARPAPRSSASPSTTGCRRARPSTPRGWSAQMAALGRRRDGVDPGDRRPRAGGHRGRCPGGEVRRAGRSSPSTSTPPLVLLGPHARRPGGDRAARARPRAPVAGRCRGCGGYFRDRRGPRRLRPPAARPHPRRRPRRPAWPTGIDVVGGPAQRRSALRPVPGAAHGDADARARARPGDRGGARPDRRAAARRTWTSSSRSSSTALRPSPDRRRHRPATRSTTSARRSGRRVRPARGDRRRRHRLRADPRPRPRRRSASSAATGRRRSSSPATSRRTPTARCCASATTRAG